MKELNNKLAQVQTKLKAKKSSYNSFGKYYFRKSEDILEAIKPFLIELGVSVTITEELVDSSWGEAKTPPMLKSTANFSDGDNTISATAIVGVDLNQKGMQTAQQFGAASTYGKKYALGNLLLIDDTEDADASNKHGKGAAVAAAVVAPKQKQKLSAEAYKKAKEYLEGGGKIEAIKQKYELTPVQTERLEQIAE